MSIRLPVEETWVVRWYTGKVSKTRRGTEIRFTDSYYSKDKNDVEKKAKELETQSFELVGIFRCLI